MSTNGWNVAMNEEKYFCQQPTPPPHQPSCWGDNSKTSSRQPKSYLAVSCKLSMTAWRLAAGTDLDTAGLRRRRGHTVRSRSLPRCRRSWRDRDQYSQSTSGSQAGSPACPRGRCRPSPWPAPRGPGPGGRGSSCQTGPPPAGDQSALEREVRLIRFYDSHNLTSQWKERRIAEVNCQYLWDGGNVILK